MEKFDAVACELREKGAQCIVLGCTELSVIKRDYNIGAGFIDAMEALALRSLEMCEAPVKFQSKSLITK